MPRTFSGVALRRRRRDVTREALALAVGRTVHTIAAYESGKVTPSADMVGRLAEALECDVSDLYSDGTATSPAPSATNATVLRRAVAAIGATS